MPRSIQCAVEVPIVFAQVLFFVLFVLAPMPPSEAAKSNPPRQREPRVSEITLKKAESASLAVIEHVGPYWTVGPVMTRVRDQMDASRTTGPLVLRFQRDPRAAPVSELFARIGFALAVGGAAPSTFAMMERDAEWVASMTITGRSPELNRDYPAIYKWIHDHGYAIAGPVTELYDFYPVSGPQTEIQVAVRLSEEAAALASRFSTDRGGGNATLSQVHDLMLADGEKLQVTRILDVLSNDGRSIEPVSSIASDSRPPTGFGPAITEASSASSQSELVPLRELAASRQFDRLASRLIRDRPPLPPEHRLWLGHVVFRVNAAARGLERIDPAGAKDAVAMAAAIVDRYRSASETGTTDPLLHAVVRINIHADPLGMRKREIIRRLDELLARMGQRTVSAETAFSALIHVLEKTEMLLYAPETDARSEAQP